MPKVTMPLGSTEARGHVGEGIIFQGTVAKTYRKPRNKNTPAQAARRSRFFDVTRTLRGIGTFARGALRSQLGRDWFAVASAVGLSQWDTYAAEFDLFAENERDHWRDYAPYQYTKENAGKVFYIVARSLYAHFQTMQLFLFGMPAPVEGNSYAVHFWYVQGQYDILPAGEYDANHYAVIYDPAESWQVDDFGLGGSPRLGEAQAYTLNADNEPALYFYFFGTFLTVYYMRSFGYGIMRVEIDNLPPVDVSQSLLPYGTFQYWTSATLTKGLHLARISQVGAAFPIYFDGVIIG